MNEENQKYKAEFKKLKFKSKKEFEKTATYKIKFEDKGQDCLEWWIDDGGEVLHANLQTKIWNGMIVDLFELLIGEEIGVMDTENQQTKFYDFVVEEIVKV